MTAEQFAYWMQGFAELNAAPPTEDQWNMIRDHLALVFKKVTPHRVLADWATPGRLVSPGLPDPLLSPRCAVGGEAARTVC